MADKITPITEAAPAEPKKILLYCRDHAYCITLETPFDETREVIIKGARRTEKIKQGEHRLARAKDHRMYVQDGEDIDRVRKAAFYGFHFIEALPDPKMPRGAQSLLDLYNSSKPSFHARLNEMEKRGHKRVNALDLQEEILSLPGARDAVREFRLKAKEKAAAGK